MSASSDFTAARRATRPGPAGTLTRRAPRSRSSVARARRQDGALDSDGARPSLCTVGFGLFLLVNLILFVRPGEIFDDLENLPIYEAVICLCLLASVPVIARQLSFQSLAQNPATVFMFGMLGAIVLSSASQRVFWNARIQGVNFLKVTAYYLLITGLVSTPRRFRLFALFIFFAVSIMAILILLQNYNVIDIADMRPLTEGFISVDGVDEATSRVVGLGIFRDPNDLSLILTVAAVLGFHFLAESPGWLRKVGWAVLVGLVIWTFGLTGSRGGLLSMAAAIGAMLVLRLGWRRGLLIAALIAPIAACFLGARQTNIDLGNVNDTAQGRMEIWRDSLVLFHSRPIFGLGADQLVEEIHHVAHNSFVQAFVETGLLGGTMFVGVVYLPIWMLLRIRKRIARLMNDELMRWNATIVALCVGYAVGMFSLSRNYTVPAYLPAALATAWAAIVINRHPQLACRFGWPLLTRVLVASVFCLASIEFCARFLVR
jgi:O-Antigen ligase